jgi:hypothetical protein
MPWAGSSSSSTSPPASAIASLKGACRIVTRSERVARMDRSCSAEIVGASPAAGSGRTAYEWSRPNSRVGA